LGAVGFFEILARDTGTVDVLTNYVCGLAKLELAKCIVIH